MARVLSILAGMAEYSPDLTTRQKNTCSYSSCDFLRVGAKLAADRRPELGVVEYCYER